EQQRAGFINSPERIDTMLNQLLLIEQMAAKARKLGLDKTPEFRAARVLAEDRELTAAYRRYLYDHAPAIDAKALAGESYAATPKKFAVGDSVDVRHILIKTDCRSPEAARSLAERLRERVVKGEPMDELARKYSEDDGTKEHGGLIRGITRGKTTPAFEKAAFAMTDAGELSQVVETPFGYHLIELLVHSPGRQASLDEIQENLAAQLEDRHRARYLKDQSDQLLSMPLEGNPERLRALRTRYGNADVEAKSASVLNPASTLTPTPEE
ncbi:MAG: peptidylprolyl isomerase, partial [Lysobacterales bacterium]